VHFADMSIIIVFAKKPLCCELTVGVRAKVSSSRSLGTGAIAVKRYLVPCEVFAESESFNMELAAWCWTFVRSIMSFAVFVEEVWVGEG